MAGGELVLPSTARNLGPAGLITVAWVGFALAASLVAVRCYARLTEVHRFHMDDYWLLTALLFLLINAILQTLQTPSTFYLAWLQAGKQEPPEQTLAVGNLYVRYEFVIIAFFWTVCWCVKASFLAMYKRLFDGLPHYLRLWWVVVLFTAGAYIGCWFASAWTCHPPSTYFHFGTYHLPDRCECTKPIDVRGGVISISYSTAVDILSDLMIMALPIRIIPSLQVSRAHKRGLVLIFCVGFFVIAAAVVRLTQIVTSERTDPAGLSVWGLVESSISVCVGSLPALKALISRKVHTTFRSGRSSSKSRSRSRRLNFSTDEEQHELSKTSNANAIASSDRLTSDPHYIDQVAHGQIVVEREYIVH
ncbi:hypothetical protein M409DRAFT_29389 [Zasmidium cellare ATCC 36951]|uniref:Rhodopsin domain-containing protein n=1 Tax=Zasmidium cellare ATCC 36951 TaxID=1080233 RepID=A0A6A6BZ81_ZASCE|nr:uncharacterized protein M409DRAFT_29389 [Zasmidium cellare ATCC 36951]KAF2160091.1 hypothetical protein M409DRAFT_29389 [Zasmidium cellare ATCC 36951]